MMGIKPTRPAYIAYRLLFYSRSRGKRLLSLLLTATFACGVFALILILSIMNGLQSGYINAIVEVSSYHLRIEGVFLDRESLNKLHSDSNVLSVMPFYETQTVMTARNGHFFGYLLRAVPPDWQEQDEGMALQMKEVRGRLDVSRPGTVLISRSTALSMGLLIGDEMSLISLSAPELSLTHPPVKKFTVSGIYETAFREIDEVLILTGMENWDVDYSVTPVMYGIKLKNRFADQRTAVKLASLLPSSAVIKSWRDFHRSFFSALRLEKFAMSFLLGLVAAVVVLNLYFMIRRLIFEKQKEIAVYKTMGIPPREIQLSFLLIGIFMGSCAVFAGVFFGLFVTIHFSSAVAFCETLFYSLFGGGLLLPDFRFFYDLPVRIDFEEVVVIACLSLAASAAASYAAAIRIAEIKPCEVMRYE